MSSEHTARASGASTASRWKRATTSHSAGSGSGCGSSGAVREAIRATSASLAPRRSPTRSCGRVARDRTASTTCSSSASTYARSKRPGSWTMVNVSGSPGRTSSARGNALSSRYRSGLDPRPFHRCGARRRSALVDHHRLQIGSRGARGQEVQHSGQSRGRMCAHVQQPFLEPDEPGFRELIRVDMHRHRNGRQQRADDPLHPVQVRRAARDHGAPHHVRCTGLGGEHERPSGLDQRGERDPAVAAEREESGQVLRRHGS